jgi:phage gp46-like protein
MFDLATRPQPNATDAASVFGVPFDWRLVTPGPAVAYPYKNFTQENGVPVAGADVLASYSVELEDTWHTAIILSLFTNRRAGVDDVLPLGVTDRHGWVGEEFATDDFDARADAWGSRLWLVYYGKRSDDVLEAARFAAQEALDWLVRDGIAERIVVTAQWAGPQKDRLAIRPTIYRANQSAPVYDVLWGTSIAKLASAGATQ